MSDGVDMAVCPDERRGVSNRRRGRPSGGRRATDPIVNLATEWRRRTGR
jgi:hypothetical protein